MPGHAERRESRNHPPSIPRARRRFQRVALVHPPGRQAGRLLTTAHLGEWGIPSESAAQIVAELAANAVAHGRVPGRDFRLDLAVHDGGALLRIEVSDARGACVPPGPGGTAVPDGESEAGRGLLIVEALADRWGVSPGPLPRKTVWAELDLVP